MNDKWRNTKLIFDGVRAYADRLRGVPSMKWKYTLLRSVEQTLGEMLDLAANGTEMNDDGEIFSAYRCLMNDPSPTLRGYGRTIGETWGKEIATFAGEVQELTALLKRRPGYGRQRGGLNMAHPHETFTDPELTDSQGQPAKVVCKTTAWGGFLLYVETKHEKDFAAMSGDCYKRLLAWLVTR